MDSITRRPSISVSVQPFFLLTNAGKVDLEVQPLDHKFAYVLSAEFYGGRVQDDFIYDRLNGFGIGLLQKYKFKKQLSSPYFAYGAIYRHQEIAIETEGFSPYQDNGLTYYEFGPIKKLLIIDAVLLSTTFGYQKVSNDFVYDFYIGLGYKTPLRDLNFQGYRKYDQYISSYAYKGFGMLVGFKIGYQLQ